MLLLCSYANAAQQGQCALSYRPLTDETAFAAVGAPLKVADRHCQMDFLIIPFSQKAAAVTLPKGEYAVTSHQADTLTFSLESTNGDKVKSCLMCDPISGLEVKGRSRDTLCVVSGLNVHSCAPAGSVSFAVTKKEKTDVNLCTPGLVYFGRDGNELKFAINDCQEKSRPILSYDLRYGNIIRFLDEQFYVMSADNQGIYFKRLEPAVKRKNEL